MRTTPQQQAVVAHHIQVKEVAGSYKWEAQENAEAVNGEPGVTVVVEKAVGEIHKAMEVRVGVVVHDELGVMAGVEIHNELGEAAEETSSSRPVEVESYRQLGEEAAKVKVVASSELVVEGEVLRMAEAVEVAQYTVEVEVEVEVVRYMEVAGVVNLVEEVENK